MKAPLPTQEKERLQTLHDYAVLDTPPEEEFDDIVRLASQICETPIALISLVDSDRQWFKAKVGLEATETSRDVSFCSFALTSQELLVVPDATQDPRFSDNPLVTGDLGIRFYAGAPLVSPDGHGLGALCVIDHKPRNLTADQEVALRTLSRHVMAQLNLQRYNRDIKRAEKSLLGILEDQMAVEKALRESQERFEVAVRGSSAGLWDWNLETDECYYSLRFKELLGYTDAEFPNSFSSFSNALHPEDQDRISREVEAHISEHIPYDVEYRLRNKGGEYRWFHARGQALWDRTGKAHRMAGSIIDIHERKLGEAELEQVNRSLMMLSQCNEALNRLDSEQALLTEICRIAVETGGHSMAWVGYAEDDEEGTIKPQAHSGVEEGYLEIVKAYWKEDRPEGRGPAGRTIRSRQATVVPDLSSDPSYAPWADAAAARGYTGKVSLPLKNKDGVFGILALYQAADRIVSSDEVHLLQDLADNLAFGITAIRARDEQQRLHDGVLAIAQGVSSSVGLEFFGRLNEQMAAALEADLGIIAVLESEDTKTARTLSATVKGEQISNFDYHLVGTPCEEVILGDLCVVERGVRQQYPGDGMLAEHGLEAYAGIPLKNSRGEILGLMAVLFSHSIEKKEFIISTLRIFATRAASEIERKQSDFQVSEQAALLDKAQDAILVRDLDHRITFWNHGAERLYGWSSDEALDRSVEELFYPDTTEFKSATSVVMDKGEWIGEIEQTNKAGQSIVTEGRWTLVRDEEGLPKSILAINTDITERKRDQDQITQALREKEVLLKEIHHRVKNNLQVISSLLALQTDGVDDLVARDLLTESQHRVRAMAMIHEKLYQSSDLARVGFDEYVNNLVGFLLRSYSNGEQPISLEISCDPVQLGIDTASPCGLIINELVSNALKHAFPDGRSGKLRVELREENGAFSLTVADNGIGLPDGFDLKQANSLGLQLVETLSKQIKANLTIQGNEGTSFRFDFKELVYSS